MNNSNNDDVWLWAEKAKLKLNHINSAAPQADLEAQKHLRNTAQNLFKAKVRKKKGMLNVSSLVEIPLNIIANHFFPEDESKDEFGMGKQKNTVSESISKLDSESEKIMYQIPLMNVRELRLLIREIMNKKSVSEIYQKLELPKISSLKPMGGGQLMWVTTPDGQQVQKWVTMRAWQQGSTKGIEEKKKSENRKNVSFGSHSVSEEEKKKQKKGLGKYVVSDDD